MDFSNLFNTPIFQLGDYSLAVGNILSAVVIVVLSLLLYRILARWLFNTYFDGKNISDSERKRIKYNINYVVYLLIFIGILSSLKLDPILYEGTTIVVRITTILVGILIILLARLLDWIISKIVLHDYYIRRDKIREKNYSENIPIKDAEGKASRTVQYIVYVVAIILFISMFNLDYVINTTIEDGHVYNFKLSNVFTAVLILLIARLIAWVLTQVVLYGYYRNNKIDLGSQYAINQLLTYVIYVIAILIALENLGLNMTAIWGGAVALLVGVGLGLQQTFNDFFSGVIILFERSIEVGDVLEVNGLVGKVIKIGLRASLLETVSNVTVVMPNSKLTMDNVINWSHFDKKVRFSVRVGTSYGSDTELVKTLLLQAATEHTYIVKNPEPFVRFIDFGDSSLDFELFFWSYTLIDIDNIKSDLRYKIDSLFREHNITIPFPQRSVWTQKDQNLSD